MLKKALPGVAGLLLVAGAAIAQPPPPPEAGPAHRLERMAILLDLSDAQKQQLQQVLQQQRTRMRTLHAQALASGQKPSFEQMRTTREQMRQDLLGQAQSFLSADQLKKLQVLLEEPPRGPRGHGGPPPGGPPGPP